MLVDEPVWSDRSDLMTVDGHVTLSSVTHTRARAHSFCRSFAEL